MCVCVCVCVCVVCMCLISVLHARLHTSTAVCIVQKQYDSCAYKSFLCVLVVVCRQCRTQLHEGGGVGSRSVDDVARLGAVVVVGRDVFQVPL